MGERPLVLGLGQRVDRPELLAPAGQALEPAAQRLPLLVAQLGVGRRGLELEPRRELPELVL
jgi:hypothetical protein